jgi:hypothetical protein
VGELVDRISILELKLERLPPSSAVEVLPCLAAARNTRERDVPWSATLQRMRWVTLVSSASVARGGERCKWRRNRPRGVLTSEPWGRRTSSRLCKSRK